MAILNINMLQPSRNLYQNLATSERFLEFTLRLHFYWTTLNMLTILKIKQVYSFEPRMALSKLSPALPSLITTGSYIGLLDSSPSLTCFIFILRFPHKYYVFAYLLIHVCPWQFQDGRDLKCSMYLCIFLVWKSVWHKVGA